MSVYHMLDAHRDQKRSLDPLELEVKTVVSYHMGSGNRTGVLLNTFNP